MERGHLVVLAIPICSWDLGSGTGFVDNTQLLDRSSIEKGAQCQQIEILSANILDGGNDLSHIARWSESYLQSKFSLAILNDCGLSKCRQDCESNRDRSEMHLERVMAVEFGCDPKSDQ